MTYSIIGTGNIASFLTTRLHDAGFICKGIYGRNVIAAKQLAKTIDTTTFASISDIPDTYDFCVIAVSDNAIEAVSTGLKLKNTVIIHTSGAVKLEIIPSESKAVLWFIYSIIKNDFPLHKNIPAIYEASSATSREVVIKIATALSDLVQEATWEQRELMHLTAVMANNFTNHILAISEQIAKEKNIPYELFKPIILQTFERVTTTPAYKTQTGPARRNDNLTIARQIELLGNYPQWQEIYEKISASIKDMYDTNRK